MLRTALKSTRKTFTHNFYDKTEIKDVYEDGKRFYLLPNGSKVPSVTTVLSSTGKDHITAWRNRVGHAEADKITTQAKNRGTAIHTLAERYLLNIEDYDADAMPVNKFDFQSIKKILDENVDNIYGIEYPLYSYRLKTAGRTDLIAEWQGKPAIIDFKTSRKIKKPEWIENYFLQATCYSLMAQERINISCPDIVIIIAVDHEDPQIFCEKRKNYLDKTLNLFTKFTA